MPIRFRCAYCNQLMGISHRKAGKVVRCPKCAGEIIVPIPEGMDPPAEEPAKATGPLLFDEQNFEQQFNEPANGSVAAPTETAAVPQTEVAPSVPPLPPLKRRGLFLPLPMLFLSLGVVILLLISMFVLGLIIGRGTGAG